MTALSAGFALLPLLIDPASPGKEILHPVAVTIFGGLISATLLDAILTPLLFQRFGERPLRRLLETHGDPEPGAATSTTREAF
jgi:HME family heavy-metal exporter